MRPRKRVFALLLLIGLSSLIAVLLCEFLARIFLNPADYLSLDTVDHKILGRSVPPKTAGFDDWGFRNPGIPETADIVAIGDSHTYGNCATMRDSWPYALARLTGKSVYNLGLGGYGPNQYHHLLTTRALSLKPSLVICGMYFGDDFENAYLITYGLEHWAYLRQLPAEKVNYDIWEKPGNPSWHKRIRIWLSRHSVVYKLVFHGALVGRIKGNYQIKNASRMYENTTSLMIEERNIREAFFPRGMLRRLNQESEGVQEGMRITLRLLKEMNQTCLESNVQFMVAVIPTKETVFSELLETNTTIHLHDMVKSVIVNERKAREKVFEVFRDAGIRYVDTLPFLKQAAGQEIYTRSAVDIHPNGRGYRVIAEAIAKELAPTPSQASRN